MLESLVLGPVIGVSRRWLTLGDVDLDEAAAVLPDRIWRSVRADREADQEAGREAGREAEPE